MPFSPLAQAPKGLVCAGRWWAEDACGPFPSSVYAGSMRVLHAWAESEEDRTSVPPITRPFPNRWTTQALSSLLQPPCQTKWKDKLFVFNKSTTSYTVHLLAAGKLAGHYVNLVDTDIPMG
jgi:hypothetical protein